MHIALVIVHVSMMIASLALMTTAIILGFFGKHVAAKIATIGGTSTVIGGISGAILLFGAPLSLQCAELTAYLIGVCALYVYGFAYGDANTARLIRRPSVQ